MQPQVLSPKSSNSRSLQHSPLCAPAPASPAKSLLARPVSPLKHAASVVVLSSMVEKAKSTRTAVARKITPNNEGAVAAGQKRGKRGAAQPTAAVKKGRGRAPSNSSQASASSTSTTVVTKKVQPSKKGVVGTL